MKPVSGRPSTKASHSAHGSGEEGRAGSASELAWPLDWGAAA